MSKLFIFSTLDLKKWVNIENKYVNQIFITTNLVIKIRKWNYFLIGLSSIDSVDEIDDEEEDKDDEIDFVEIDSFFFLLCLQ